jgi:hypothetical protein
VSGCAACFAAEGGCACLAACRELFAALSQLAHVVQFRQIPPLNPLFASPGTGEPGTFNENFGVVAAGDSIRHRLFLEVYACRQFYFSLLFQLKSDAFLIWQFAIQQRFEMEFLHCFHTNIKVSINYTSCQQRSR